VLVGLSCQPSSPMTDSEYRLSNLAGTFYPLNHNAANRQARLRIARDVLYRRPISSERR